MRNTIKLLMIFIMGVLNLCCLCFLCSPTLRAISSSNVLSSLAKPRIYLTIIGDAATWPLYYAMWTAVRPRGPAWPDPDSTPLGRFPPCYLNTSLRKIPVYKQLTIASQHGLHPVFARIFASDVDHQGVLPIRVRMPPPVAGS
jgi:hypothetical protein